MILEISKIYGSFLSLYHEKGKQMSIPKAGEQYVKSLHADICKLKVAWFWATDLERDNPLALEIWNILKMHRFSYSRFISYRQRIDKAQTFFFLVFGFLLQWQVINATIFDY